MLKYFKRKATEVPLNEEDVDKDVGEDIGEENIHLQVPSPTYLVKDLNALPLDPGERPPISAYHPDDRDENEIGLERFGQDVFSSEGFTGWNHQRERYKRHVGENWNNIHNQNADKCKNLLNQHQSIQTALNKQSDQAKEDYRICLNNSVRAERFLMFNGMAFRGHDESEDSPRKGNFLNLVELLGETNEDIGRVILKNAPGNLQLTSPSIQKQIASCCSSETIKSILNDLGDGYFSILVDESRDVSHKEQMALVLRFINKKGEVIERLVGLAHVTCTAAESLKATIYSILEKLCLSYSRIRGQGYDGASNMRGHINGLRSKILEDCSSAHYIHCFAHQLQLTLVSVAHKHSDVEWLIVKVNHVVNVVGGSYKRRDELRRKQAEKVEEALLNGEKTTGKGLNQEMGLQRPGDTRWGSHFKTFVSILMLFDSIVDVLTALAKYSPEDKQNAEVCLDAIETFEFLFLLHLMKNVLKITNALSQALQRMDQDIINAMSLLGTAKTQLQLSRDEGWDSLVAEVSLFCEKRNIDVPNMDDFYICRGSRSKRRVSSVTNGHYYQYDVFYSILDMQFRELNDRFGETSTKLLLDVACLNPTNSFYAFDKEKILEMAGLYMDDFDSLSIEALGCELDIFIDNIRDDERFFNLNGLVEFSKRFVETNKYLSFPRLHLLLKLALILPVSTATVERVFSAMKYIKTKLRNRISEDFLSDTVVPYFEYDLFRKVPDDDIMNSFQLMKRRRINY